METQRLLMRPLTREDAAALYALTSDASVARFMRFDTHTDPKQAEALMAQYLSPENRAFAVIEKESGAFVGVAALLAGEQPGWFGLSTMNHALFWNRGYASETLAAILAYAREDAGITGLTAHVVEENLGSRRVLEKNGFSVAEILHFPDLPGGLYVYQKQI